MSGSTVTVWRPLQTSSLEMAVAYAGLGAVKAVRGMRYKLLLILPKLMSGQKLRPLNCGAKMQSHIGLTEVLNCSILLASEMY